MEDQSRVDLPKVGEGTQSVGQPPSSTNTSWDELFASSSMAGFLQIGPIEIAAEDTYLISVRVSHQAIFSVDP